MGSLGPDTSAQWPVAIVGGGPTGLSASILLSQVNIPHILFERYPSTSIHPKAIGMHHRTVEIWRKAGVEEELKKHRSPPQIFSRTAWYTSFGPEGREIVARDAWGGGSHAAEYDCVSPCQYTMLPQIRLEPLLKKRALELNPKGIFYGTEVIKVEEADEYVLVTYQRKGEAPQMVKARYCIGADGGRGVTDQLGIGWEGQRDVVDMVSAHVRAPISLHHPDKRNFITWFVNPKLGGTIGAGYLYHLGPYPMQPDTEEWLFACGVAPGEQGMDGPAIINRMHNTLQIPDLEVELLSTSYWYVNGLTATRFRSKPANGRVFLVGDAAHRIPPWGALGLNTGMQDVDNLVWKLNFAINGIPPSISDQHHSETTHNALLDTYDAERRPIGQRVRDLSLHNLRALGLVMDHAIGVSPTNSQETNIANMASFFDHSPDNKLGAASREAVSRAVVTLDDEFHAFGAEIGWFYPSVDVNGEGDATRHDGQIGEDGEMDLLKYHPSTIPGHHLPHAWLERGTQRLSTRDLVRYDGFVLFTSRADLWEGVVEADGAGFVTLVEISGQTEGRDAGESTWKDVDGQWAAERGVGDSGAVLVRPDGIVVWRAIEFDQVKHGGRGWFKVILRRSLQLE